MLNVVIGDEGRVVTVFCNHINIGGLTQTKNDAWHWALYCLRNDDPATQVQLGPLGGTEPDQRAAFSALRGRWERWLAAAGLTYGERKAA